MAQQVALQYLHQKTLDQAESFRALVARLAALEAKGAA